MTRHLLDEVLDARQRREDERRMPVIAERVKRGAALLDEKRPGWWQRIDLGRLDVASDCDCVGGQLPGGYGKVADDLFGPGVTFSLEVSHGFEADGDFEGGDAGEFAALTEAWRSLILARRAAQVTA